MDDFARYLYLPRLTDPKVLLAAIESGVGTLTWQQDAFAYAESYDETAARYRGLQAGQRISLPDVDAPGLLVQADVAWRQIEAEQEEQKRTTTVTPGGPSAVGVPGTGTDAADTRTDRPEAACATTARCAWTPRAPVATPAASPRR